MSVINPTYDFKCPQCNHEDVVYNLEDLSDVTAVYCKTCEFIGTCRITEVPSIDWQIARGGWAGPSFAKSRLIFEEVVVSLTEDNPYIED